MGVSSYTVGIMHVTYKTESEQEMIHRGKYDEAVLVNVVKRRSHSINTGTVFLCNPVPTTIHHRSKNNSNSLNLFSIKSFCISLRVDDRAIIPPSRFTWKKKRGEFKVSADLGVDFVDGRFFETDEENWTTAIDNETVILKPLQHTP